MSTPIQKFNYYLNAMFNFKDQYPTLAFFVFLGLMIASIYLAVQIFKPANKKRSTVDLHARITEPALITDTIIYIVVGIFLSPIYVLSKIRLISIKLHFYFAARKLKINMAKDAQAYKDDMGE